MCNSLIIMPFSSYFTYWLREESSMEKQARKMVTSSVSFSFLICKVQITNIQQDSQ